MSSLIGVINNWKAFDGERKYRCIVHNTCSDHPCLPCSIKLELLKDEATTDKQSSTKV